MNTFIVHIPDWILLSDPSLIPRLIPSYVTNLKQEQVGKSSVTDDHTFLDSTSRFDPRINQSFDLDMSVLTSVNPSQDPDTEPRNISDASHITSQVDLVICFLCIPSVNSNCNSHVHQECNSSGASNLNPSLYIDANTGIVPTILLDVDPNVLKVPSSIDLNLKLDTIVIFIDSNSGSNVNPDTIRNLYKSGNPSMIPGLSTIVDLDAKPYFVSSEPTTEAVIVLRQGLPIINSIHIQYSYSNTPADSGYEPNIVGV